MVTPIGNKLPLGSPLNWKIFPTPQLSAVVSGWVSNAPHCPGVLLLVKLGGQIRVGSSVSVTVTVNVQEAVLPPPSVATSTTVLTPTGKDDPLANPLNKLMVDPQLSEVVPA